MSSRYEELLERLLNDESVDDMSPESRMEACLMALIKKGGGGGSGQDIASIARGLTVVENGVSSIGSYEFSESYNLETVWCPNVVTVEDKAFYDCEELRNVYLPNATTIGNSVFRNNYYIKRIDLPSAVEIGSYNFYDTVELDTLYLPKIERFGSYFHNCDCLKIVVFGNAEKVCELIGDAADRSVGIGGYTFCHIYVPRVMFEKYKTDTAWVDYTNRGRIRIIEDYSIDGTVTGEIDRSKALQHTITIDGKEYQVIAGMTWEEWINSEYNVDGWVINSNDNYIYTNLDSNSPLCYYDGSRNYTEKASYVISATFPGENNSYSFKEVE